MSDAAHPSAEAKAAWIDLIRAPYGLATGTLSLGVALSSFNTFFVATALPTAVVELGGVALISWSLSLYLIFSIVSGFSSSALRARYGARLTFLAAAFALLCGTLLAGAATDMTALLIGRAMQGIGSGLIQAGCYAIIPAIFPSRLQPKIFGVEAMAWALGASAGPLIAGYLTETISWRAAFLINTPLILLFAVLVLRVAPSGRVDGSARDLPILQLVAIAASMLLLTISGAYGIESAAGMVLTAVLVMAAVVRRDKRASARLFPTAAFGFATSLGLGFWIVLLMPMAQAATSVYLVFVIERLWGYSPSGAGALNAIMALSWSGSQLAFASFGGERLRAYSIRLGAAVLIMGLIGLLFALETVNLPALILAQVAIGSAFGLSWGHLSQTMMAAAPAEEIDKTASLLPTVLSAGYAMGAALMGLIGNLAGFAAIQSPVDLQTAMRAVLLSGAALAAAALGASLLMAAIRPAARKD